MPSALCRQSHLHSGFITPWSISSSRLCSSSEVINLDSSPTQRFQSLTNFLPYPHPSLNIPFPLPLYSLFWHHHSPSYPGEKSGSHSGHPLTTSNTPWGLLINLSQMHPLFSIPSLPWWHPSPPVPWTIGSRWPLASKVPSKVHPPPLVATANTPLCKLCYLLPKLKTLFGSFRPAG